MIANSIPSTAPDLGRKGVSYHPATRQYRCRVGFHLNAEGKRTRSGQNLGTVQQADDAIVKHIKLVREWDFIQDHWTTPFGEHGKTMQDILVFSLPPELRDRAEVDRPVWIKLEWLEAAVRREQAVAGTLKEQMAQIATSTLRCELDRADAIRTHMKQVMQPAAPGELEVLSMLDADVRARAVVAAQPTANEAMGLAVTAECLTVAQARQRYLDDLKARIGLSDEGIKENSYNNTSRFLRLAMELRITDSTGASRPAIDPACMLHDLTRDDLVTFKRGWLAKVGTGKGCVARRTAATYIKAVQYWLAWVYKRDTIVSRRVSDLDDVFKMTKVNPIKIADYAAVRDTLRLSEQKFPVTVQSLAPDAPAGHRGVVLEPWDGDQFRFSSMMAAEEFMRLHDLVPVRTAEMAAMRHAVNAGDDEEGEAASTA